MIHNPSAYAYGNSEALQKEIELLNTVKEAILDIYCSKSKLARDKISEEMNNEKWFNAKQALEAGFVDEIVENDNSLENIKKISNELNINNFIHKDFLEEKLKVIKNTGGEKMIKNISDLLNDYPQLMEEFKNQVSNEIKEVETKKVENAILEERKRIEALEKIPFMNDKQKEIINKAKYEVPRTPTEIMAEFFMSNANKASEEISKIKAEHEENEITKISPSTEDLKNSLDEQLINAALNAFNER